MSRKPSSPPREDRLSVGLLMLLIAGAALGLWLVIEDLRRVDFRAGPPPADMSFGPWDWVIVFVLVFLLGGLSLVGPPLLLLTARKRRWGPGRLLWFAQGTASWLLWPPVVYRRVA